MMGLDLILEEYISEHLFAQCEKNRRFPKIMYLRTLKDRFPVNANGEEDHLPPSLSLPYDCLLPLHRGQESCLPLSWTIRS